MTMLVILSPMPYCEEWMIVCSVLACYFVAVALDGMSVVS